MIAFLTEAWAEALNGALDQVTVLGPGSDAGLGAIEGRFRVAQEVVGGPQGDVLLVMTAADGELRFSVRPLDRTGAVGGDPSADVTIALAYHDAAALAQGALSPAEALNEGRIRVRGDLSVLVAAQQMLESTRDHLSSVQESTTY